MRSKRLPTFCCVFLLAAFGDLQKNGPHTKKRRIELILANILRREHKHTNFRRILVSVGKLALAKVLDWN